MSPRWLPTHVGRRIAYLDKRVVTNTFLQDLLLCHDAGATEAVCGSDNFFAV